MSWVRCCYVFWVGLCATILGVDTNMRIMLYSKVILSWNCVMRWLIKAYHVFVLCLYHIGEVVYGLCLLCLWWPIYIIVVRSSKCPQIGTIQWYLDISDSLQCLVTGLSLYGGLYEDLAMFKVKLVEVWRIYIQNHDLSIYLKVKGSDYDYLTTIWWDLCLFGEFMIILRFSKWFRAFVTWQKFVE